MTWLRTFFQLRVLAEAVVKHERLIRERVDLSSAAYDRIQALERRVDTLERLNQVGRHAPREGSTS